jgi:imidazolonepropionase-like amidohydrolase
MREAGVRLACGSDASWSYYKLGDFQSEIEAHMDTGMTEMEAIVSATSDSARSCWIDDEVGALEPGKQADLLVVDGDPSTDIKALRNVVDVFQSGNKVDRQNRV